ncbi:MAG: helix-turn-helix transcriptional regulator [Mangrovibacterium sp.]
MICCFSISGFPDFYRISWFDGRNPVSFAGTSDMLQGGKLQVEIREWHTTGIVACRIQCRSFSAPAELTGELTGEAVCLIFTGKGRMLFRRGKDSSYGMPCLSNNLFYRKGGRFTYQPLNEDPDEFTLVFFHPDYIREKARQYPEVFASLSQRISGHCSFELNENHLVSSPETARLLEQLQYAEEMGAMASFYLEMKSNELFLLQMKQCRQQQCAVCLCFSRYREQIEKARKILEEEYRDPPGIRQLALQVGMCETMLKAGFKSFFGTTVFRYLFDFRMDKALKMLKESRMNIGEISEETGYGYPSHFTTAFKRKYRLTPLEYRKMISRKPKREAYI